MRLRIEAGAGQKPTSTNVRSGAAHRASKPVERTSHAAAALVEDVRIDHRRVHVGMAEAFLDGTDVIPSLKQARRERVSQHVGRAELVVLRSPGCGVDRAFNRLLVQVVPRRARAKSGSGSVPGSGT